MIALKVFLTLLLILWPTAVAAAVGEHKGWTVAFMFVIIGLVVSGVLAIWTAIP